MKTPPIYEWKRNCEIRIEEIKEELRQVESYSPSPLRDKKIDRLERELDTEYASLEDYKGRIQIYESQF